MADPRQGRASVGGHSRTLGHLDPRIHRNAQGLVTDADIDGVTLARDDLGRTRIRAADGIRPLSSTATLADVVTCVNQLLSSLRGES